MIPSDDDDPSAIFALYISVVLLCVFNVVVNMKKVNGIHRQEIQSLKVDRTKNRKQLN